MLHFTAERAAPDVADTWSPSVPQAQAQQRTEPAPLTGPALEAAAELFWAPLAGLIWDERDNLVPGP